MMERVWGGNRLERLYGKHIPPGKVIGESWELVDRPEAQSVVQGGPYDGWTLRAIIENDPAGVLGNLAQASPDRFPLLIKYVDAGAALSVQVHPDDHGAIPFKDRGKSECWVVVHLEGDGSICRGLKPGTTRSAYEAALREDRIEDVLHFFTPKIGDLIALPPGLVHAIGSGVVVAEIQQNSDLTFRIYDYNRKGLDGKPRPLHVKEALESIRFDDPGHEFEGDMRADTVTPLTSLDEGGVFIEHLLEGVYFSLVRCTFKPGTTMSLPPGPESPRILMSVGGEGVMNGVTLKAGDTTLLCAACGEVKLLAGPQGLTVLLARPTLRSAQKPV